MHTYIQPSCLGPPYLSVVDEARERAHPRECPRLGPHSAGALLKAVPQRPDPLPPPPARRKHLP
eukprot:1181386-Prorocentrum_minimum.AAC.3